MRIAVISLDCGGSRVAAEVVHEAIERRLPHMESSLFFLDDLWPCRVLFGVDWYLLLAKSGCYRSVRFLIRMTQWIFGVIQNRFFKGLLAKLCSKPQSYDLIISMIPLINPALCRLSKERNIPLFVVATDMDSTIYSYKWPQDAALPEHRFGVFCNHPKVLERVHEGIERSKLVFTGGYVKGEFTEYSEEDRRRFAKELGLPQGRSVIALMMGSLGGRQLKDYVQCLLSAAERGELEKPLHIVVFCGKNFRLKHLLERRALEAGYEAAGGSLFASPQGNVSLSFLGYTEDVFKVYALSSGLITKPGGGSINEALAQRVPLLIDNIRGQLPWEELASHIVCDQGLGAIVKSLDELPELIHTHFLCPEGRLAMKRRQGAFISSHFGEKSFSDQVISTIEELTH